MVSVEGGVRSISGVSCDLNRLGDSEQGGRTSCLLHSSQHLSAFDVGTLFGSALLRALKRSMQGSPGSSPTLWREGRSEICPEIGSQASDLDELWCHRRIFLRGSRFRASRSPRIDFITKLRARADTSGAAGAKHPARRTKSKH